MDGIDMIPYMTTFAEAVDLTAATDWLRAKWI